VEGVRAHQPLGRDDKLFAEFAWRAFFHHVWAHEGSRIFSDLRPAIAGVRYTPQMPDDVMEGRTGLAVIDQAVACLYQTGYLHNHARMWLASYLVHLRHVHWRVCADWRAHGCPFAAQRIWNETAANSA
jgi:deoxyribodipyrimidine photo-lyase